MSGTHGDERGGDWANGEEFDGEEFDDDIDDGSIDGGADDEVGVHAEGVAPDAGGSPRPVVVAGPVSVWWTVAAVPFALLALSWLAGAPQLALPVSTVDGGSAVPTLAPA